MVVNRAGSDGSLQPIQVVKNGTADAHGKVVGFLPIAQYLAGLTALAVSYDGKNVYVAGTKLMPSYGGEETYLYIYISIEYACLYVYIYIRYILYLCIYIYIGGKSASFSTHFYL